MRAGSGGRAVVPGTEGGKDERTKRREQRELLNAGREVDISSSDESESQLPKSLPSSKLGHGSTPRGAASPRSSDKELSAAILLIKARGGSVDFESSKQPAAAADRAAAASAKAASGRQVSRAEQRAARARAADVLGLDDASIDKLDAVVAEQRAALQVAKERGDANSDSGMGKSDRPRLTEPVTLVKEASRTQYKTWRAEISLWYANLEKSHSAGLLTSAVLKQLPTDDKTDLFVEYDAADLSVPVILKFLDEQYDCDIYLEGRAALKEYRKVERGEREELVDFVKRWRRLYSRAQREGGLNKQDEVDALDLLEAARVTPAQMASMLESTAESGGATVVSVIGKLTALGRAFSATQTKPFGSRFTQSKKPPRPTPTRQEKPTLTTLPGGIPEVPKCSVCGKAQKDHPSTQKYPRGEWCKKPYGGDKAKPNGGDKGKPYTGEGGKGQKRGRDEQRTGSGSVGRGNTKKPKWREGDWNCQKCGDHQFASNKQCRKCGAAK